MTGFYRSKKGC